MIPPNQGSSLSHDSSINMTPRDNCYISVYEGPNEIYQDVPNREQTVLYVVKVSYPEGETVSLRRSYKFYIMKSHEISHLGKTRIIPNL